MLTVTVLVGAVEHGLSGYAGRAGGDAVLGLGFEV